MMYYGDIKTCTTDALFTKFQLKFFQKEYKICHDAFLKGLEYKNFKNWDKLDGNGCMDLFLRWNNMRKQYFNYKGEVCRPSGSVKKDITVTIIKKTGKICQKFEATVDSRGKYRFEEPEKGIFWPFKYYVVAQATGSEPTIVKNQVDTYVINRNLKIKYYL